jgi:tetratricopeptide (TPR) repeat protein
LLAVLTRVRNRDYRDEMGMWADVVAKLPDNDRARASYANNWIFLRDRERQLAQQASSQGLTAQAREHTEAAQRAFDQAGVHYEEAVRLAPEDSYWHANLGTYYLDRGRIDDAVRELELSRTQLPTYGMTLQNLGFAYARKGDNPRAIESFEAALAHGAPNPDAVQSYLTSLKGTRGH